MSRLTSGTLSLDGTSIAVQGVAPTPKDAAEIKSTIEAAVDDRYTLKIAIGVEAALDAKLCQAQVSDLVSNSSIVFAAGSAVLSPTTPGLDALVSLAQRCKSAELVIGGSAADTISKTDPDLSRRRDEAIVAYLHAIGIGSARVAQRDVRQDRPSELQDGGAALQKSAPDGATYPFTLELGADSVRLSGLRLLVPNRRFSDGTPSRLVVALCRCFEVVRSLRPSGRRIVRAEARSAARRRP